MTSPTLDERLTKVLGDDLEYVEDSFEDIIEALLDKIDELTHERDTARLHVTGFESEQERLYEAEAVAVYALKTAEGKIAALEEHRDALSKSVDDIKATIDCEGVEDRTLAMMWARKFWRVDYEKRQLEAKLAIGGPTQDVTRLGQSELLVQDNWRAKAMTWVHKRCGREPEPEMRRYLQGLCDELEGVSDD